MFLISFHLDNSDTAETIQPMWAYPFGLIKLLNSWAVSSGILRCSKTDIETAIPAYPLANYILPYMGCNVKIITAYCDNIMNIIQ